jgi:DNA-binding SARP family transcriptional activator/tetratricopeptide (TPR) repeat protein
MGTTAIEVTLSGTVSVAVNGVVTSLTPGSQRLLVALIANRSFGVPSDTLADRLFEGNGGTGAVRVAVGRARQQLGVENLLTTDSSGYRFGVAEDCVDLWQFEAQAAAATSVAELSDALRCWKGIPFGPFRELSFLLPIAIRLEELHRAVEERHLEALLAAGQANQAASLAEGAVLSEPFRERRWELLMTALYRDGRQAEALRAYQRARDLLAEGTGLEPGHALRELESRMLRQDPLLFGSRGFHEPSSLAIGRPLGRDHLRAECAQLLGLQRPQDALKRHVTAVVSGEPGGGKSTLISMICQEAVAAGWAVLSVSANEHPTLPCETLRALLEQVEQVEQLDKAQPLAAQNRHLHIAIVKVNGHPIATSEDVTRDQMITLLAAHVADVVEAKRCVLLVDDAQWLDTLSGDVIQRLIIDGRVPLLAASRPETIGFLDWALRNDSCVVFELDGLNRADTTRILQSWGAASPVLAAADELWRRSGGNPLLLRLLAESSAAGRSAAADNSVQAVMNARLSDLPQRVVSTLTIAALLGNPVELSVLNAIRPNAEPDLIEAMNARLMRTTATGQVEFVHGLVAECISAQLSEGRRTDLHDSIGRELQRLGARPSRYARHAIAASSLDLGHAVTSALAAAAEQHEAASNSESLRFCNDALALLDQFHVEAPELRSECHIRTGAALAALGNSDSRAEVLKGAQLAQHHEFPDLLMLAAIELTSQGVSRVAGADDAEVAAILDQALQQSSNAELTTRLLSGAASVLSLSLSSDRARSLFLQAQTMAEATGEPDLIREVLRNIHLGLSHPSDLERRVAATDRLRELATSSDNSNLDDLWECAFLDLGNALCLADRLLADISITSLRELTPKTRQSQTFGLAFSEASYHHAIGQLDEAQKFADQALNVGVERYTQSWTMAVYSGIVFSIHVSRGEVSGLMAILDQLIADQPEFVSWRCGAAFVACQIGDLARAERELQWALQGEFSNLQEDHTWGPAVFCLAKVAVATQNSAAMTVLRTLISPYSGRMIWAGTCIFGPYDAILSEISTALGDHQLASEQRARSTALILKLETSPHATPTT